MSRGAPLPSRSPGPSIEDMVLDPAKTDKDFEALAGKINQHLVQFEGRRGHLVMMKALMRAATASMSSDDCKDLSSHLTVIHNDKVKADREKDKLDKGKKTAKKGGKGKPQLAMRNAVEDEDTTHEGGGGGADDYDLL